MKNLKILLAVLPLLISSCAKKIRMSYPNHGSSTGTVVLKPYRPTEKTSIRIDSTLLFLNKRVRSVTITDIPAGNHTVYYQADNTWYLEDVDLQIPVSIETGQKIKERVKVQYNNWIWAKIGTDIAVGAAIKALIK